MNSLLSNSQWLGDQLTNLIEILKERENKFCSIINIANTFESSIQDLAIVKKGMFSDPRQQSLCFYSGTISASVCVKKVSKKTSDIMKIFDKSISVLKQTHFYSEQSEVMLVELKDRINTIIISKSIDYTLYLQLLLTYSKDKITLQIQKVEEFMEKLKLGQIKTDYYAGLVQNLILQKSQKKRRPLSVSKSTKRDEKQKQKQSIYQDKQKDKQKSQRNNIITNIYQNYNILELSKVQFVYNLQFQNQQQHKQKLLMMLVERNKHIKQQINNHIDYTINLEAKIKHTPSKIRRRLSINSKYNREEYECFWVKSQFQQQFNPEKTKKTVSNSKKRASSSKRPRTANYQINLQTLKRDSKSNYLSQGMRITTPMKTRSQTKIIKTGIKVEDFQTHQTKKLTGREFRQRITQSKGFWENYNHKDPDSYNRTAPVKTLRMKRHIKVNLLKSAKLLID